MIHLNIFSAHAQETRNVSTHLILFGRGHNKREESRTGPVLYRKDTKKNELNDIW